MDIKNIPLFFILGRPRSGTTLLQAILNGHPNVLIPMEAPVYVELRHKYERITHWTPELLDKLYQDLLNVTFFKDLPINREKLRVDLSKMTGEWQFIELLGLVYLNYEDFIGHENISLFGDKNPVYSIFADQIIRAFPDSPIIHIYRDYRDNIESLLRMNFEAGIPALLAYRWKFTHQLIDKLIKKAPERIYRIKYENLCQEPEKYTREICAFLGIDFQKQMLDFHKKYEIAGEMIKEESLNIHKNLKNPINTSRIGLWQKRLSEKQIKVADMVVGDLAEQAGYSRKYTRFSLWFRLMHQPILIYGRLVFWLMRNIEHFPPILRSLMELSVSQLIKIYNFLSGRNRIKNESR